MQPNDLVPVRVRNHKWSIGDKENTLGDIRTSGWTRGIIHATAKSVTEFKGIDAGQRKLLARSIDEDLLGFDSYTDEYHSPIGRSVLEIIIEEGKEAYQELGGKIQTNPYLLSYIHEEPLAEVVEKREDEIDVYSWHYVVPIGDDFVKKIKASGLQRVELEVDGETHSIDYNEFIPDADWLIRHWTSIGGRSSEKKAVRKEADGSPEDFIVEQEGEVVDVYFNESKNGLTIHEIDSIEESAVDGEPPLLKTKCGHQALGGDYDSLKIDTGVGKKKMFCGSCF